MYNIFNIVVAYCYCEFIYEMTAVQLMTDVSYLLWNLYNKTIFYFGLTKTNIHCCFDFFNATKTHYYCIYYRAYNAKTL